MCLATMAVAVGGGASCSAFDITYSITNSGSFSANQLSILNEGLVRAERMWETMITGYQPGINIPTLPIQIQGNFSGLADATALSTTLQGGFRLTTSARIRININEIENFADWQGHGANGLNFIDELLAHEMGHALGIGLHWFDNGVYVGDAQYRYTGQYGVAAYQAEFDPAATFVPVENAGSIGTIGTHWDQLMRSSAFEGTPPPANPFLLDPRVGVTDQYGRDRGLELLTGAIDPDYLEPFISRFTVQSLRDLGFTVTEFEDFNGDGVVDLADREILMANMGATGLQIDSMAFGDANRDRVINAVDLRLWRVASGIPEPATWALAATALGALATVRRRRRVD
jgi:MYXO-CTERM domain-containing protein